VTATAETFVQLKPPRRPVELTIDGQKVSVPEGTTLLQACERQGKPIPTLCYLETLHPVNVCRLCVVEVEGSRVLVPACARKAEPGMVVKTDSERVRHSRKMSPPRRTSAAGLATMGAVPSAMGPRLRPARPVRATRSRRVTTSRPTPSMRPRWRSP